MSALSLLDLAEVGAATAIAVLAGFFPFRVPRSKNSFAAGEVVIFLLLLLQGPAAATLAAAGEGLVGSWRTSKRWTSRIISPATASIAMLGAGSALQAATGFLQSLGLPNAAVLLLAMTGSALVYFLINTALITAVPYLKRGEWPTPAEMFGNFGWVGISVVGSAPVACLLLLAYQQAGIAVLIVAVPMAAMLVTTLHYFFRQQQANEAMRKHHLDAIEREAQLGARHVRELEASERRFHSAFTHASIGMALVSPAGRVVQANEALRSLLGLGSYESISQRLITDFVDAADVALLNARLARLNAKQVDSFSVELQLRHGEGDVVWAAVHGSFISDIESASPSLILQVQDVTARREAEARLQYIAFHDSLTGLPNRRRFQDDLEQALALAKAEPARHFSLMFLDFDRFKLVNDSLGHAIGDEFLIAVARRIQQNVRPNDIVARLGGDEFAILTDDIGAGALCRDARRAAARRAGPAVQDRGHRHQDERQHRHHLQQPRLRHAFRHAARRRCRDVQGEGQRQGPIRDLRHPAAGRDVASRAPRARPAQRARRPATLSVAYQPIFDLESRRITGFEALARWNHPELGAISPLSFIAIAEEAGLIVPLTDFMLRSACRQLREWHLLDDSLSELSIHVNVSGNDIAHRGLLGRVSAAIEEAQLQPRHLTLELTENILIERLEAALPTLNELRAFGVGLSLDDFGTRLLVLATSLGIAGEQPQDRSRLRPGAAARLRRGCRAARDRLAGSVARQVDHRRGHRVGRADGAASAARLPRRPGLPPGASLGRRADRQDARRVDFRRTRPAGSRARLRRGAGPLTVARARTGCQNFRPRSDLSSHR